jgi:O-antigen ligase/polysaccharide polymerase Wzy-like membrane protein
VAEELGRWLAGVVIPFALVLYLALKGGGYDSIIRSEIGIAVWWIVLIGAAVGVLPASRIGRMGWVGMGLLAGFALWTALGIGWSESSERSVAELARVTVYLGVFVLVLAVQGLGVLRATVKAVAAAIAVVAVLALLSRLHPAWFPDNVTPEFLTGTEGRLNYPLNYWNGLAALIAMGLPLILGLAVRSRSLVSRAVLTATLPVMALAAFFTFSRGGAVEIAVALTVFFVLYPRRLEALPTFLLGASGSAILIAGATQRTALKDGLVTDAARSQGDEMLAMVLVVCAGVGLLAVAVRLAERHRLLRWPRIAPRRTGALAAVAVAVGLVAAVAAGAPGELSDTWDEFKSSGGAGTGAERFESASGNGRYQLWQSGLDAYADDRLTGIGPGTFEFWWAEEATIPAVVRDAHSLYLEVLGELGLVGLLLLGGFIGVVLSVGGRRAMRVEPARRSVLAPAVASCAAFATAGALDWVWEIAVLPVTFLILAACLLGPRAAATMDSGSRRRGWPPIQLRIGVVALAIAAMVTIAIPLRGASSVQDSRDSFNAGQPEAALEAARSAESAQPYAATPHLQQALVLEATGDLDAAAEAARAATESESTHWRTWLTLSRIEAERGNVEQAIGAYREAKSLNPQSSLFRQ